MQQIEREIEVANSSGADEIGAYRSLSTSAVLASAMGLFSAIAFASPTMIIVPLAAVATALWALNRIGRSEGSLSGAGLARCGLALAILFGIASLARVQVRDSILKRQADAAARHWLRLAVREQFDDAFRLLAPVARSRLIAQAGPHATAPTSNEAAKAALLAQDPVVLALLEMSSGGELAYSLRGSTISVGPSQSTALLIYEATSSQPPSLLLKLVLSKSNGAAGGSPWLLRQWQSDDVASLAP